MATSGAAAVAAAVGRARREVREHFGEAGAFDPGKALSYEPPSYLHKRQLELLIGQGILRETGDGRYWIDPSAVMREAAERRSALKVLFVLVVLGILIALAVTFLRTH